MRCASKSFPIEQSDPRIPLQKSTFSTGYADRIARSKKSGSKRHFFDCVRMPDLVTDRISPVSFHRSDCIIIGLRLLYTPSTRKHCVIIIMMSLRKKWVPVCHLLLCLSKGILRVVEYWCWYSTRGLRFIRKAHSTPFRTGTVRLGDKLSLIPSNLQFVPKTGLPFLKGLRSKCQKRLGYMNCAPRFWGAYKLLGVSVV